MAYGYGGKKKHGNSSGSSGASPIYNDGGTVNAPRGKEATTNYETHGNSGARAADDRKPLKGS